MRAGKALLLHLFHLSATGLNGFLPFLDRGVLLTADVDADEAHISKTKKKRSWCVNNK